MESRRDTELRRDLTFITGIMNEDIEIDSQFWEHLKILMCQFLILHLHLHLKLKMPLLQKENGTLALV